VAAAVGAGAALAVTVTGGAVGVAVGVAEAAGTVAEGVTEPAGTGGPRISGFAAAVSDPDPPSSSENTPPANSARTTTARTTTRAIAPLAPRLRRHHGVAGDGEELISASWHMLRHAPPAS
jgi:hypothetical protein